MAPLPASMRRLPPLSVQPMVTLPSNGELLSLVSTQSPYQRCVPSLLANEPVSKLSRTLAAACVVIGVLVFGELRFDGVDDAQARDDFTARGGHGACGLVGAFSFDDVAVWRGRS